MEKVVLVLGASGNFGSHAAKAFAAAGWHVRKFRRGEDMAAAAKGADVIVNGLNPPMYHDWARLVPQITTEVIAAGLASGARVIVPGNVYVYGDQPGPWGAATLHRPNSRKGAIRAQMEADYRAATARGLRVLILRGGDFIDADSDGTLLNMVTLRGISKGKLTVSGPMEAAHAYAPLADMARAAVQLVEGDLPDFADIPFAGVSFSMADLRVEVERQLGRRLKISQFPWWVMRVLSPFWELARELREMRYLNDLSHRLDAQPLQGVLPDFRGTDLGKIVTAHLRRRGLV